MRLSYKQLLLGELVASEVLQSKMLSAYLKYRFMSYYIGTKSFPAFGVYFKI